MFVRSDRQTLSQVSRRKFVGSSAAVIAAAVGLTPNAFSQDTDQKQPDPPVEPASDAQDDVSLQGRIYKTLKIGMVGVEGSLTDKFNAVKEAGFEAIEMNSPGMNVEQTIEAIQNSGLPVDGTVCSTHWSPESRHTSPDPASRQLALDHLKNAIRDTHAVGGSSVLLVVGHGDDGPVEAIWKRAIDNVTLALPDCARFGIDIVVENVWNKFMYDHSGDSNQTAAGYVRFIDELNSPFVGMQFDIGNHWKYGSMGDWIRQLGARIKKLDLKGFSRANDGFTKIGEGDLDWADVRCALQEINYYGWAAAEVGGGDLDRLKEVSANMDVAFGLQT